MTLRLACRWVPFASLSLLLPLANGSCGPNPAPPGSCQPDLTVSCGGAAAADAGTSGFTGYSCSGADRPDELSAVNKVVNSVVCHPAPEMSANGKTGYCCTPSTTTCAYDPRAVCAGAADLGSSVSLGTGTGYSCMGTNRPDSFDPNLTCQQGIKQYGLITYCCSVLLPAGVCMRGGSAMCVPGTLNFLCRGSGIPTETDLGMNQSRSEVPLVCTVGQPDPNIKLVDAGTATDYCCFTPTQAPPTYTCLQDQTVTGCKSGQFGFACPGTETPDQDYPRMTCGSGRPGTSQYGVSATLYCCDYVQTP
jgi:hypothetical protein